jgi:hypothetical protein
VNLLGYHLETFSHHEGAVGVAYCAHHISCLAKTFQRLGRKFHTFHNI